MCLILVANGVVSEPRLLFLSNRDEFYDRPATAATPRDEMPNVVAGRDLRAGGTWLAVSSEERIAAVTNVRAPGAVLKDAPSRGTIPLAFVDSSDSAPLFVRAVSAATQFSGFNCIAWDGRELVVGSNRPTLFTHVETPYFGISNGPPMEAWPKVEDGLEQLRSAFEKGVPSDRDLLRIMTSSTQKNDDRLPDTGVGLAMERKLSPAFVAMDAYGTRCTTIVRASADGSIHFAEYTYNRTPDVVSFVLYTCSPGERWHQLASEIQ